MAIGEKDTSGPKHKPVSPQPMHSIAALNAYSPVDWVRLGIWILVKPNSYQIYIQEHGTPRFVGTMLIIVLIGSSLMVPAIHSAIRVSNPPTSLQCIWLEFIVIVVVVLFVGQKNMTSMLSTRGHPLIAGLLSGTIAIILVRDLWPSTLDLSVVFVSVFISGILAVFVASVTDSAVILLLNPFLFMFSAGFIFSLVDELIAQFVPEGITLSSDLMYLPSLLGFDLKVLFCAPFGVALWMTAKGLFNALAKGFRHGITTGQAAIQGIAFCFLWGAADILLVWISVLKT